MMSECIFTITKNTGERDREKTESTKLRMCTPGKTSSRNISSESQLM